MTDGPNPRQAASCAPRREAPVRGRMPRLHPEPLSAACGMIESRGPRHADRAAPPARARAPPAGAGSRPQRVAAFAVGAVIGAAAQRRPDASAQRRDAAARRAEGDGAAAVDRLTLEQQVGRMVILRFAGTAGARLRAAGAAGGPRGGRDPVPRQRRLPRASCARLTRSLRRASPDARAAGLRRPGGRRDPDPAVGRARARGGRAAGGAPCARTRSPPAATCARPGSASRSRRSPTSRAWPGAALGRARVLERPAAAATAVAEADRRLARRGRGDHGQALPGPRRRDGEHRRRARHDQAHARRNWTPTCVPFRDRDRRRHRVRDGRPRHLPGARRPAHRVAVARRDRRPAAQGARVRRRGHDRLAGGGRRARRRRRRAQRGGVGARRRRRDPHDRPRLVHPRLSGTARGGEADAGFRRRVRVSAARVLAAQSSRDG